jgi:ribosomal-protein-alanine N-acetyltransferase
MGIGRPPRSRQPALKGDGVALRPPTAADRGELLSLGRASRSLHRPWAHPPTDAAAFRRFLLRSREPSVRTLLVIRRQDARIVGVFTLSQIFLGSFRSAYLGYWVGAPHAGQGYMTEGMRLLLRYAFGRLGLHRVEANLQPGNVASRALVRRTGFRQEGFSPRYLKIGGRWRDHERWAITVEDFRSSTGKRRRPPER